MSDDYRTVSDDGYAAVVSKKRPEDGKMRFVGLPEDYVNGVGDPDVIAERGQKVECDTCKAKLIVQKEAWEKYLEYAKLTSLTLVAVCPECSPALDEKSAAMVNRVRERIKSFREGKPMHSWTKEALEPTTGSQFQAEMAMQESPLSIAFGVSDKDRKPEVALFQGARDQIIFPDHNILREVAKEMLRYADHWEKTGHVHGIDE